jgi:hypothetical protein
VGISFSLKPIIKNLFLAVSLFPVNTIVLTFSMPLKFLVSSLNYLKKLGPAICGSLPFVSLNLATSDINLNDLHT